MIYLDADTRDQCCEAIRQGQSIECLANWLMVDSERLAKVLNVSTLQPVLNNATEYEFDLWAYDRLADVL